MTQQFTDDLLISRVLHYVIEKNGKPQCRSALVVEDWGGGEKINLAVFPDGSNDNKYGIDDHSHGYSYESGEIRIGGPSNLHTTRTGPANVPLMIRWETSVLPDHVDKTVGTWHWPRECSKLNKEG